MARLTLIRELLRGGRETHALRVGANLADELRRLFPRGFGAAWRLYKGHALPANHLPWEVHPSLTVEDANYQAIVLPAGPLPAWVISYVVPFLISAALSAVVYLLTPKPKQKQATIEDEQSSANNQIAGQRNLLRPGARVPEILGAVRSFPDMITNPIESWNARTQLIEQWFVIGRGDYELRDYKLGDTPIDLMNGFHKDTYPPGSTVDAIKCVMTSATVNAISLDIDYTSLPSVNVDFVAATQTMDADLPIGLGLWTPISVLGTFSNDQTYWVMGLPDPSQVDPPFKYDLVGAVPIVDEEDVVPDIRPWPFAYFGEGPIRYSFAHNLSWFGDLTNIYKVGQAIRLFVGGTWFYGLIDDVTYSGGTNITDAYLVEMDGVTYLELPVISHPSVTLYLFDPPASVSAALAAAGPSLLAITPTPSEWQVVPMVDPQEIWVDIAYPQGLAHYSSGVRYDYSVTVLIEFRRGSVGDATDARTFEKSASSTVPLRYTLRCAVAELTLADTDEPIQVRVTRTTTLPDDTGTDQYISETRWQSLRAMREIPERVYPEMYLFRLRLSNTRSAASIGELVFNCIATRKLPQWSAGAWSAPVATERWADNLVARMKSTDGAKKEDADIDLEGIYDVQDVLDAMDIPAGAPLGTLGDQGRIGMTLDQMQDIDAELQAIASVARCTVYRIGRKLYVHRDEGGQTALALFTGRSKAPEAETVGMTMKNDTEPDAVLVQWIDRTQGWKVREYQNPPTPFVPLNALRLAPACATWAQAWRRARYEMHRIELRRDSLSLDATEEARLLHPGDVINVTDDVANLAQSAGEVIEVEGLTLTLDLAADMSAGSWSILLRAMNGRDVDTIAVTAGAEAKQVVLAHAPAFAIQGRGDGVGTMYALFADAAAVIRPWLVTSLAPGKDYTTIVAENYREDVYADDTGTLPDPPLLLPVS